MSIRPAKKKEWERLRGLGIKRWSWRRIFCYGFGLWTWKVLTDKTDLRSSFQMFRWICDKCFVHTYIHTIQPLWLMIWKSCITFGKVAHMTQLVGRIYATVQCNNALLHKSICKKTKNVTLAYWPRHDHGFWILVKMLTFHTINLEPRFMEIIVTWRYGLDKWNCYHHYIPPLYALLCALFCLW